MAWREWIKQNHGLTMVLCCAAAILLLGGAYFFGVSKQYLFWFALILCPVMHIFLMKDMHKSDTKGGKCH